MAQTIGQDHKNLFLSISIIKIAFNYDISTKKIKGVENQAVLKSLECNFCQ